MPLVNKQSMNLSGCAQLLGDGDQNNLQEIVRFSSADVKESLVKRVNEKLQNRFNRFKTEHIPEPLPSVPGHRRKLSVFENYIYC